MHSGRQIRPYMSDHIQNRWQKKRNALQTAAKIVKQELARDKHWLPLQMVLENCVVSLTEDPEPELYAFLRAGPRAELAFSGEETKIGICTCGGLCPGLVSKN